MSILKRFQKVAPTVWRGLTDFFAGMSTNGVAGLPHDPRLDENAKRRTPMTPVQRDYREKTRHRDM